MKKRYLILLTIILLFTTSISAFATDSSKAFLYRDEKAGLEFIVPAYWIQNTESSGEYDVLFESTTDKGANIKYVSKDIWSTMPLGLKLGHRRSEMNNSTIDINTVAEMMGVDSKQVSLVSYGDLEFYKSEETRTYTENGYYLEVIAIKLLRYDNGFQYVFSFIGTKGVSDVDFEALVESIKFDNYYTSYSDQAKNIISAILCTIIIYCVPIIIYRYAIVKKAVERKKAKRISIIYGIIAFILTIVWIYVFEQGGMIGAPVVILLCWINYMILSKTSKVKTVQAAEQKEEVVYDSRIMNQGGLQNGDGDTGTEQSSKFDGLFNGKIVYCRNCGAPMIEGEEVCNKCNKPVN